MRKYLLQTPYGNVILFPQSRNTENSILDRFRFDKLKENKNKINQIKLYISHLEEIPSFREKGAELLGKVPTDYSWIKCFKVKEEIFYVIENKGYLSATPERYTLFLNDLRLLPFFVLVLLILYNQWKKNAICLHSGCFKYRNNTYLVVGKSESGKTTFLINLKKLIPEIEFVCDDLSFIFSKNKRVYCRGILDSYEESLKHYRNKDSFHYVCIEQLLDQKYQTSIVDNVLFLNITQRKHSTCRKIKFYETCQKLFSSTTLWNTFNRNQFKKGIETLLHVVEEINCISLELGIDIKNGKKNEKQIFSRILEVT